MSRARNFCAGLCTLPAEVLDAMPDEGVDELAGFMRDVAEAAG